MTIELEKIILIFMRIASFMVMAPGLSYRGLPNIFKLAIAVSLSVLIYSISPALNFDGSIYYLIILAIKETLFGLAIAYLVKLIFSAIEMAGQLLDFQVGFSMAAVFDASTGTTSSNYGRVYYWMSMAMFFIMDMHHRIIESLVKSFEYVPLDSMEIVNMNVEGVVNLFSHVFETALNLAAPMIIVVLVVDTVLGVISRTIPQINVLMLGMPAKSMISFMAFLIILGWLSNSMGEILLQIPGYLDGFMREWGGG